MSSTTFMVEHIDIALPGSFEEATARFYEHVPLANPVEISNLKNRDDIEAMMASAPLGIRVMTRLEQGPVVSLLGTPMKVSVYLIGSPLLGAAIFVKHRGAGLYAPAHVTLYEDIDGITHFAYDKLSTLLAQFGPLGHAFDEKLAHLGELLTRRAGE